MLYICFLPRLSLVYCDSRNLVRVGTLFGYVEYVLPSIYHLRMFQ